MGKLRLRWGGLTGCPDNAKMWVNIWLIISYLVLRIGLQCSLPALLLRYQSVPSLLFQVWIKIGNKERGDIFPYLKTNKCNFNDRTGTWKKRNFSCFYGLAPNNPGVWRIFASFILLYVRKENSAQFYFSLHFSPLLYGASLAETECPKSNLLIVDECRVLGSSWHGSPHPRLSTGWKEDTLIMLWQQTALILKQSKIIEHQCQPRYRGSVSLQDWWN